MSDIQFPSSFGELSSAADGELRAEEIWEVDTVPGDLAERIEELREMMNEATQQHIDTMFNTVRLLKDVDDEHKKDFVSTLSEIVGALLDTIVCENASTEAKNSLKTGVYMLTHFATAMEVIVRGQPVDITAKTKGKGKAKKDTSGFDWFEYRLLCIQLLHRFLSVDANLLWPMSMVPENFTRPLYSYISSLLEEKPAGLNSTSHVENGARLMCVQVLQLIVNGSSHHEATVAQLLHSVCTFEHMSNYVAEITLSNATLTADVIAEISSMNMTELAKSGSSLKHVGHFLSVLGENSPSAILTHFAVLITLLDSDAYQIRNAIVSCLGSCLKYLHVEAKRSELSPNHVTLQHTMFNILIERTHDVSSYTRSTVLKVWSLLIEAECIDKNRYGSIAEVATDRLHDKTAAVRKSATSLLTCILDYNPFGGVLQKEFYTAKAEELLEKVRARKRELYQSTTSISDEALKDENADELEVDESDSELVMLLNQQQEVSSCLLLLSTLDVAMPVVERMLNSKTSSDVVDALRFFTRAVNFGIPGSAKCLQKSFSLIWHQEESIQLECIGVFRNVFLTDGGVNCKMLPPKTVALNLIQLVSRCSEGEVTSVEKILGEMFRRKELDLSDAIITTLWNTLAEEHNAGASCNMTVITNTFRVLTMIAKYSEDIVTSSTLPILLGVAFNESVFTTAQYSAPQTAAMCLCTCRGYLDGGMMVEEFTSVYESLGKVLLGRGCGNSVENTRRWFAAAEEAVHAIYHLHPSPDKFMTSTIHALYAQIASSPQSSASSLSRLIFLLGQVALCTVVYTEKLAAKAKKVDKRPAATSTAPEGEDAMESEMGMVAEADAEHDKEYTYIVEQSLVVERNLLGLFHPLVVYILANSKQQFNHPLLRETSVLALCRFMSVSSVLCEQYLPLLFTVLEKETSESLRTSIIIAIGDLSFRFPNAVEPWTANIYARLNDPTILVRYNTLLVLTHLILNDMIKVKGQVSYMVMCLNDPCDEIRSLAELFFNELAKRSNNPVYNLLGDIIGSLSRDESEEQQGVLDAAHCHRELTKEEFQRTMNFLLSFVKKDKQADSLLERLLIRMSAAHSMKQKRYLAYCVSQIPMTEKGLRKLTEIIKLVKECLLDNEILEHFMNAISKVKKLKSDDMKGVTEDFTKFVESVLNGADDENLAPGTTSENTEHITIAQKLQKKAPAKKAVSKRGTTSRKKKVVVESDDEEGDGGESEEDDVVRPAARSRSRAVM